MADGYSDKSISPVVYTPTVDTSLNLNNVTIESIETARLSVSANKIVHNIFNDKVPVRKSILPTLASGYVFEPGYGGTRHHILRTFNGTWLLVCWMGVFRSTDNRKTWSLTPTSTYCAGQLLQIPNGRIFTNRFYSDNDGLTWTAFQTIQNVGSTIGGPVRSPLTGTIVACHNRGSNQFTMKRSTNNGDSFTTVVVTDGVTGQYYDPWVAFATANGSFLVGGQDGGIWKSSDDGVTFLKKTPGTIAWFYNLQFFQTANGDLYCLAHQQGISKSTDDGETWTKVIAAGQFPPFVKEIGDYILMSGPYGSNLTYAWIRYFDKRTNTIATSTVNGGVIVGNQNAMISMALPYEYDGVIYTPIEITTTSMGILETDLRPITYANLPTFKPTNPAKLSEYGPISITLDTTGSNGTITALVEHKNDEIVEWSSLTNVEGEKTPLGTVTSGVPITLPSFESRAGEEFRLTLGFQSNDGILPAPSLTSISIPWASDVEAPDTPSLLDFVDTSKTSAGYRIDFGDMPANARHIIMEGKINDSEYLPFSNRAKFEVDNSHMRFRGSIDAVEAQGERNESHVDFRNGLVVGDIVKVKIATEDSVGNRSAFTESADLVLSGVTYVPVLTTDWTETWNDNVWRETWTQ